MKHVPKYNIGQLLLYKLREDEEEEIDLGMIVGINPMAGRLFGHYTYNIEWFKDLNIQHKYVEEDTINIWVKAFNSYRTEQRL